MTLKSRTPRVRLVAVLLCGWIGVGCGSSSSTPAGSSGSSNTPVSNILPVMVDGGPVPTQINFNVLYASVTICVPGSTTQCQTIDGVQVDTGSSGLRLLSSVVTLPLPQAKGPGGGNLAECLQFSNSSTWGSVRTADIHLAGEVAGSVAFQVIGDPALPTVPKACTNGGFPSNDNLAALGANGILGVGNFIQDCGPACAASGASNPGLYYECSSATSCSVAAVQDGQQVQNPVALFPSDNNGVTITLPAVSGEATTLQGSLFFGIGTQANNAMGGATVLTFNNIGYLGTQFNGQSLAYSFVDSGSSGFAFPDKQIKTCADFQDTLFCPTVSPVQLSAVLTGANGATSGQVNISVGNADKLFAQFPNDAVFPSVCSPALVTDATAPNGPNSFDWGLSFFYGRTVFTALEQRQTPGGAGPYVAF